MRAFGRYAAEIEYPRVTFSLLRKVLPDSSIKCIFFFPVNSQVIAYFSLSSSLIQGLVFNRSGFFVNTSRIDPKILRVDSRMLKMADSNEFAIGIMLGVVTECFLIAEGALGQHHTVHKISIAPFAQEMRRDTSLWGEVLGFDSIIGSVSEEGLSFSTRAKKMGTSSGKYSFASSNLLFTFFLDP